MRVSVRPARPDELSFLQAKANQRLPDGYGPVDLRKRVVYVAEDEGVAAGMAAAGLTWHVEPLILFPEFEKYAPGAAKRKATYLLARAITDHLDDAEQNCGIPGFFAHLGDRQFEELAKEFGLWPAYKAGTIYKGGSR